MHARFKRTRETANFYVYEAQIPDSQSVQVIYLPRVLLVDPPDHLEIIIGTREIHRCNCEYCTRRTV